MLLLTVESLQRSCLNVSYIIIKVSTGTGETSSSPVNCQYKNTTVISALVDNESPVNTSPIKSPADSVNEAILRKRGP